MTDVAVRRLRTSSTRAEAEALLRRAVAEAPDRCVLIVRQLLVAGNDPDAARHRLAELRRTAARPTPGGDWPGPSTDAVLFEDEAQLLACLTADVIAGAAAQRWYWRPRLARAGVRPLLRVWLDAPRWLPAALELLEEARPGLARAAVASLAATELRAVTAAVTEVGLRPPHAFGALEPPRPAPDAALPQAVVAGPPAPGRIPPPDSAPARQVRPTRAPEITGATQRPPEPAPEHAAPAPRGAAAQPWPAAPPEVRGPAARQASGARQADPGTPEPATLPREPRTGEAPAPTLAPSEAAAAPEPPRPKHVPADGPPRRGAGASPEPAPAGSDPSPARRTDVLPRRRIPDAPFVVASELAGVCYLLALMLRLSEPARSAGPTPTWTELSAFGRRVLRRHLDVRLRADPLWAVLGALAAHTHETGGGPRGSEPWWPHALRLLSRHAVGPSGLIIPGRISVTRTHVDVLFTLDQIDLRVRRAGLDQDPGWVPSLGRIVSFHYL